MGILDWLFGFSPNTGSISQHGHFLPSNFKAMMMQEMTVQEIAAAQYLKLVAQLQFQPKPKPDYKWDGKPWYLLDLANRPTTWNGKLWYPLEVKHEKS